MVKVKDVFIEEFRETGNGIYPVNTALFLMLFSAVLVSALTFTSETAPSKAADLEIIKRIMSVLLLDDLPAGVALHLQVGGFLAWLFDQSLSEDELLDFLGYDYLAAKWNEYAFEQNEKRGKENG